MSLGRKGSQGKKGEPEREKESTGPATKQIFKKKYCIGKGRKWQGGERNGWKEWKKKKTFMFKELCKMGKEKSRMETKR